MPTRRDRTRPTASTRRSRSTRTSTSARYWARTDDARRSKATTTAIRRAFDYTADRYGASVRAPQGRRQLQSRGRLRAPRQLPPLVRVAPLQPAAGQQPAGAQVHLSKAASSTSRTAAGLLETRQQTGRFNIEFKNSDRFTVDVNQQLRLPVAAVSPVARRRSIPVGGYDFNDAVIAYNFGQQRRLSGNVSLQVGEFYDGDITTVGYSQRPRSQSPSASRWSRASR